MKNVDHRFLLLDALVGLLGVRAPLLLQPALGRLGELAQGGEVLDLLARARVAVDDHVLAADLAALDLGADLRQRERAEVQLVLLHQPALLVLVGAAAGRLHHVERRPSVSRGESPRPAVMGPGVAAARRLASGWLRPRRGSSQRPAVSRWSARPPTARAPPAAGIVPVTVAVSTRLNSAGVGKRASGTLFIARSIRRSTAGDTSGASWLAGRIGPVGTARSGPRRG